MRQGRPVHASGVMSWVKRYNQRPCLVTLLVSSLALAALCSFLLPPGQFSARGHNADSMLNFSVDPSLVEADDLAAPRKLRSWEEARAKARSVAGQLTQQETYDLVHGFLAPTNKSDPEQKQQSGYYVGNTKAIKRLSIPALKMQDSHNGFRASDPGEAGTTTQWPCVLALASSWDEDLVAEVAAAIGREFRGKGANVMLGPAVNVHRVGRGGRNFEFLSGEDPFLGARLTRAFIQAVQDQGIMTVVKHFAFNEQETNRKFIDAGVSDKTAWELYYPPFQAAIEAGTAAVMCSFNKINGTDACSSHSLLLRDLKDKMGFDGFVMSDWQATQSTGAIASGLDVEMPNAHWFSSERLLQGSYQIAVVEAAIRVMTSVFRMRLDEEESCELPCIEERRNIVRTAGHVQLARKAAAAGIVLLRNDGILPLDSSRWVKSLAIMGSAANANQSSKLSSGSAYAGGGSHSHVVSPHVVTPLAGIRQRAGTAGVKVRHYLGNDIYAAQQVAAQVDVVVVVGATITAEGWDRRNLSLDDATNALIDGVCYMKPTIVLLETSGAVLTPWRDRVSAVANLFHAGEQTGNAWAALLFGDAEPKGRLPITFPATEQDTVIPSMQAGVRYSEGIFTSYRSPTFNAAYAFGHGLSYTHFSFGRPHLMVGTNCSAAVCLRLMITNVGGRPGSEMVQAYLHFTTRQYLPHASLVLRGFRRTRMLQPGKGQNVTFAFNERDLSLYSVDTGGWVRPMGIEVHLGASSADIRQVKVISRTAKRSVPPWYVSVWR